MPLTPKGRKVLAAMRKKYGDKKGESVFYASIRKGTLKGAEAADGITVLAEGYDELRAHDKA